MLKRFKVSNFKSFADDIVLDFSQVNGYEFNSRCIRNGLINNAIVYGHNGCGKSNLSLAIFDIMEHLTDVRRTEERYSNYLNARKSEPVAKFEYTFLFDGTEMVYRYHKSDYRTIEFEELLADGRRVLLFDRSGGNSEFTVSLDGTETLNNRIDNKNLSALKYVRNNSVLQDTPANKAFARLFSFVEGMLFFRSLDDRLYIGKSPSANNLLEEIVQKDLVADFENFLHRANIECELAAIEINDSRTIAFRFGNRLVEMPDIWSTGTSVLTLFYCWYQSIKSGEKSFVFIDEFDAFYHFELSKLVIELMKDSGVQFVLTTHNTSNLSNDLLRPDCYFVMTPRCIKSLSRCTRKELREAHNIEKMYKAGSFDVG